jgi:hypothetical protein
MNEQLARLVELRESLDVVVAQINAIKAKIADMRAQAGPDPKAIALVAGAGVLAAMLVTRGKR